jgi:hypothetical protein
MEGRVFLIGQIYIYKKKYPFNLLKFEPQVLRFKSKLFVLENYDMKSSCIKCMDLVDFSHLFPYYIALDKYMVAKITCGPSSIKIKSFSLFFSNSNPMLGFINISDQIPFSHLSVCP